ncbi:SDR family oxidoreductase [Dactylosporangium sp. CS-047395]|uniref:SDR family oxidoreductase n=1 Tax=Dactylosporangium sp. CS-047395 TaxID=3239936 RepID=UPI003D8AB073
MTVLVVGATGSIGREVVAALIGRGAAVRALVRSPERAAHLPPGVEAAIGDLGDAGSVAAALRGVRAALYVSPHDAAEERLAAVFVRACEDAGVRIVFAGVYLHAGTAAARFALRAAMGLMLPHYRGKLRLAHAIGRSRTGPVLLSVTNYFQNDEMVRDDILAGSYPLPVHRRGVNRIDLRDVAAVAARALCEADFPAGGYALVGPASIPGARAAELWSAALGRPVRYDGPGSDWQERVGRHLTGRKRLDVLRSYGMLAKVGVPTSAKQVAAMTGLLGRPPRTYESYVDEAAARLVTR